MQILWSQIQALIHEKYWGLIKVVTIAFNYDDLVMIKVIIIGVSTTWFQLWEYNITLILLLL